MERFLNPGQWDKDPKQYYDTPLPEIIFAGKTFVLTGVFALGDRSAVEAQIRRLGGKVARVPSKAGCTVVVGTLPSQGWVQNDAGRKLLEALELRDQGYFVAIIPEDVFSDALVKAENAMPQATHFQTRSIDFVKLLRMWLTPLAEEFDIVLTIDTYRSGYVAYPEGQKKLWLCRLFHSTMTIEPHGCGKKYVPYMKILPEKVTIELRQVFSKTITQINITSKIAPRERLPAEEIKRRNSARKAAMRAKPVTPEVQEVAKRIMNMLRSTLPQDVELEEFDRAKYYVIGFKNKEWICRLHYKTKNKYLEINGKNKIQVKDFSEIRIEDFQDYQMLQCK